MDLKFTDIIDQVTVDENGFFMAQFEDCEEIEYPLCVREEKENGSNQ